MYTILDLYCGAGGSANGYGRAGFAVVGVDIKSQPHYPYPFVRMDALEYAEKFGHLYDAIHASPPCQIFTAMRDKTKPHQNLIPQTRKVIQSLNKPYIIENVSRARSHLINPIVLCGTMFGLRVIRHRLFECSFLVDTSGLVCRHEGRIGHNAVWENGKRVQNNLTNFDLISVTGHDFKVRDARIAMGIDWMVRDELAQAIPPAFTEHIGRQLIDQLNAR